MRFAARPVGAANKIDHDFFSKMAIRLLISVVLPVPGPPVMTSTRASTAMRIAAFCSADNSMSPVFSTH